MRTNIWVPAIFAAALSGYAFAQAIPMSGVSNAPPGIKSEAAAVVERVARRVAKCRSVKSIRVEVVRAACGFNADNCDDLPEWTTERWTARTCGKDVRFRVTFALDRKVSVPPIVLLERRK